MPLPAAALSFFNDIETKDVDTLSILSFLPHSITKFLLYSVIGFNVSGSDSACDLLYFISANCKNTSPGFHLSASSPDNSAPVLFTSLNIPSPVINGNLLP